MKPYYLRKKPKHKIAYFWRFFEEYIWHYIWLLWYRPLGNSKNKPKLHKFLMSWYDNMSKINHWVFRKAEIEL